MSVNGQKTRVLHLGNPLGLYGAERWILALVRHLDTATVDSVVGVILDDAGQSSAALCERAAEYGFRTVQIKAPGRLSRGAVGQLREYIVGNDIDVLHTHGYKTDLIGLLAVRGTRCRIVSTPHGWSTDAGLKLQCYEWLDRLAFRFMDAVAPLSPDLHAGLAALPGLGRRLVLIPNGVDLAEIGETGAAAVESLPGAGPGEFVFGYVGQLIQRKRVDTLIDAFGSLAMDGARLWIVGEGDARQELEAQARRSAAADRIHFFGFRDDRIALLKHFDAFVLPSSLEGIPRCLMEAMGAGVAVIATRIPGCTDIVSHEETGLLFDCGNERQLRDAMGALANDVTLRQRLVDNAGRRVRADYSAEAMARRYEALYAALAASHPAAAVSRLAAESCP